MNNPSKPLSIFSLAMINVAVICSIKNWPITAEYGFSSVFFYIIGTLFLFIPVSLVSAELATGWPKKGGIYIWIKEAFGENIAFLAIWLLWVENVVWYPTILSFLAGTLAYAIHPSFSDNPTYTFVCILLIFWGASLINLKGMKTSSLITNFSVIFGTIVPGIAIILMGLLWMLLGKPSYISFTLDSFFPPLDSIGSWVLLVGVLLGFSGMEMSSIHANDVNNPQRDYPRAIAISGALIVLLSVLGTLAIAIVVPQKSIALHAGGMEAMSIFLRAYGMPWAVPLLAIFISLGAFGGVSTWLVGPTRGLLAAAQAGDFPPLLHKENKHGMPTTIIIGQAIIVSILSLLFLFLPSVNSSFWILIAIASQVYLVMYGLLFVAAIRLRYKAPTVVRQYKIPFGNTGMWIVALTGFTTCVFCFFLGFVPPSQLEITNFFLFESIMVLSITALCFTPYIILRFKKPSWKE